MNAPAANTKTCERVPPQVGQGYAVPIQAKTWCITKTRKVPFPAARVALAQGGGRIGDAGQGRRGGRGGGGRERRLGSPGHR